MSPIAADRDRTQAAHILAIPNALDNSVDVVTLPKPAVPPCEQA